MQRQLARRRGRLALVAVPGTLVVLSFAPASSGDLGPRVRSLQQSIASDNSRINAYQGRLSDLRTRLAGIENSLAIQRALLTRIEAELAVARTRLVLLREDLVRDRSKLMAQLVAQYESPPPDLVDAVLESHGFADLLERIHQMKLIAKHNTDVVRLVARIRAEVTVQASRLRVAQARQKRVLAAVLVERDQVASLQLAVLKRVRVASRDRARKQAELRAVEHRLAVLQARAAAAQQASFSAGDASGGGTAGSSGTYGFFPAPGTNYSVGEEPTIAARLNALGLALHLHLIGLSGYRSPQHSVEVGGFADDPHTRGEASDTPGVEGVPEPTLLRFGLTRPFPGPAEADHIQLA
jgi:peptidoglycan hydrolase CwlO-like protein